jgi:acyl-CoA reductase-like NAD-dependent aldehyde dehydrogenase
VPYYSLDVARVAHHRTREPFVEVSQANPGLIRRDLSKQSVPKSLLNKFTTRELVDICTRAAAIFTDEPDDYIAQVSATTGLPHALAQRNMLKIKSMLASMESVLNGLTRGVDWTILDRGFGDFEGRALSFYPRTQSLGAVLPNNSPGVHSLWIPAFALRIPLVLKPGSAEPWTPYRIIQSLIKAGAPAFIND